MKTTENTNQKDWGNLLHMDIPIIDDQHSNFLKLLENIQKSDSTNNPIKNDYFTDMLNKLQNYMKDHFSYEEKLMQKAGYKNFKEHRLDHLYFLQKIDEFKLESQFNSVFLHGKVLNFMKKWFLNHIIQTDSKYKQTIKKYLDNKKPMRNLLGTK